MTRPRAAAFPDTLGGAVRRLAVLFSCFALAGFALAGCGSSSSSSGGPLTTALSYLPANSPLVLAFTTDPHSGAVRSAQSLVSKIPLARLGEAALQSKLQQMGINYDADVRPLLGNPLVFGASTQTVSQATGREFVFAWVVKDADTFRADLKKSGAHSMGTRDGATLYPFGAGTLALDGSTVVASPDSGALKAALDRHAHGTGITSSDWARAVKGLPGNALVDVFGSLTQALSSARTANARRVPWVAAVKGYAVAVSATSSGLALQYRVDTSGGALTSSQLPFTPGSTAPSLAGTMPVAVGIHDPAHAVAFLQSVEQATNPGKFAAFQSRQTALRRKTGVDVGSLTHLLTGDLIIESDLQTTIARAAVSNATAARHVLAKLASAPPRLLFTNATTITRAAGGFYVIKRPGGSTVTAGVVGNQLVAGEAAPSQLRAFATAPAIPAVGAKGPVAFRVALADLLHLALHRAPSQTAQVILGLLGDITGWIANSPAALTGNATLQVK
jgi:Protein of unknown function (DUF3352)